MKTKSLPNCCLFLLWAFGLLSVQTVTADPINILTPPGSDQVEGDTKVPWEEYSSRFQQVFDASLFKAIIPNGGWIQTIYLRADGPSLQPSVGILSGAEITLSTTTKGVVSLSPVFADNVGSDVKVLLSRSQRIYFTASGINQNGVRSYGPLLYYSQSGSPPNDWMFFYDPSKGNLLMDFNDVIATDGSSNLSAPTLDAVTSAAMSSVFSTSRGNPIQGVRSSKGLVMLFQVTPVPEPSVIALGGLGIVGLSWLRRINGIRKKSNVSL